MLHNNVLVGTSNSSLFLGGSGVDAADVESYWRANNDVIDGPNSDAITTSLGLSPDIFYGTNLANNYLGAGSFTVTSGTLTAGADFTPAKLADAFFDKVQFRGAFGATDWTAGWAEFNPVDKVY